MNLFLLRHGLAVEPGTPGYEDDSSRPLTQKGRRALREQGAAFRRLKLEFDLILSSPFVRARETAEIIAAELKLKKYLQYSDLLKSGSDHHQLIVAIHSIRPAPENLLLVGHEPDLSELISLFTSGKTDGGFALKKGGLAKLEVEKLRAGQCATLSWLLTPKLMQAMN